ncbi:MAG: Holliday junction branch migration protein RuvA [Culicoidibacterales bacterium]
MYYSISGKCEAIMSDAIALENNGVSYHVFTPEPYTFELGSTLKMYTYVHVREDVLQIFGFETEMKKNLFLQLLSVKGVGPKVAMTMLAATTTEHLQNAIVSGDAKFLKKIPGIGPKAAAQIVLDLQGKMSKTVQPGIEQKIIAAQINEEGKEALLSLGYNEKELDKVLPEIDATLEVGQYIKQALARLLK